MSDEFVQFSIDSKQYHRIDKSPKTMFGSKRTSEQSGGSSFFGFIVVTVTVTTESRKFPKFMRRGTVEGNHIVMKRRKDSHGFFLGFRALQEG